MNQRARFRHELEAAVLTRMELSRTQLLAANVNLRLGEHVSSPRNSKLSLANIGHALGSAPNVTLLGSIVLGSLLLGPKRVMPVVVRTGVTSWLARSVRGAVGR